jgi:cytochrome c
MFDMMTITKAGASVCAALLFLLLGGWAAESLYHVGGKHHAGDDHEAVQGYRIAVDTGNEAVEEVVEIAFADVYATADASAGERQWRQCSACHKLEAGANGTGPYLHGVVGREKHTAQGFDYSDGLLATTGAWTPENISEFLLNPRAYAPGTKMAYRGLPDVQDRANLIAYLATFN